MSTEILPITLPQTLFKPGHPAIWLLEIDLGPLVARLAHVDVDVEDDATGEQLFFYGGIQRIDFDETLRMFEQQCATATVTGQVLMPIHIHEVIARGHHLAYAPARLYRWVYGSPYSTRALKAAGWLRDPEYGAIDEPVAFTIAANLWQDTAIVPPRTWRVEGTTWQYAEDLREDELQQNYPIVYGTPGKVSTRINPRGRIAAHQARLVMNEAQTVSFGMSSIKTNVLYLVAGHHVGTTRLYIMDKDDLDGARVRVMNGHDGRGQPVALLPWWYSGHGEDYPYEYDGVSSPASNHTETDGSTTYTIGTMGTVPDVVDHANARNPTYAIYVAWVDDIDGPSKGGLTRERLVREAGDVLIDLLQRTHLPVDVGRCEAGRARLRKFKLDFVIEATQTAWDVIRNYLAPILPVSFRTGPRGVYFVAWDLDATQADAQAHIDLTGDAPEAQRVTTITCWTDRIINDLYLDYARSARTGKYNARQRVWSGESQWAPSPGDPADLLTTEKPSFYCRRSQSMMRQPNGRPLHAVKQIQTPVVYDDATASAICQWMTRAFHAPIRKVRYAVMERDYAHLQLGDVILLTDPSVGLDRQIAFVEEVGYYDDSVRLRLGLVLWDDPFAQPPG